jgi:hypothetical protein
MTAKAASRGTLHNRVVAQLQTAKGTWPTISEATNVSLRTIQKIASREIVDPAISNIEKLAAYFERQEA